MTFLESLFDGMDTPTGLLAGSASIVSLAGPFFPMFPNLRAIFPPPIGWTMAEAATLAAFACLAIKTFLHTFGREMRFEAEQLKLAGGGWVLFFMYHYITKLDEFTQDHDPVNLIVYAGLFVIPTFSFTAMQLQAASNRN